MKRFYTLLLAAMLISASAMAQRAEIRRAAQHYKNVSTLTANVTMTRHNAAITKDTETKGTLYYKKPDSQSMVFKKQKEMLLAIGNKYTMVRGGKARVAKPNSGNPFEVLKEVFGNILSGNESTALSSTADVNMSKNGNICTVTITPKQATKGKKKRRAAYTSCIATIDLKSCELRTLRINERGSNYTQYDFSGYKFNATVGDGAFSIKAVQ